MLPCVHMSLLAVNCVPLLHSRGCREHGWLAGQFCHHPGGQLRKDLCLPCSPSLSRCSQPAAPRVHSCKMWEHQRQTKPSSFQQALTVQTTKRWRWCGTVHWTSLWDLMKPRNIRGEKDRKKWGKRGKTENGGCDPMLPRGHLGWRAEPVPSMVGEGGGGDLSWCCASSTCLGRALVDEHPPGAADPPGRHMVSPHRPAFPSW